MMTETGAENGMLKSKYMFKGKVELTKIKTSKSKYLVEIFLNEEKYRLKD